MLITVYLFLIIYIFIKYTNTYKLIFWILEKEAANNISPGPQTFKIRHCNSWYYLLFAKQIYLPIKTIKLYKIICTHKINYIFI